MSEAEFLKNFKKWFWSFLAGQFILILLGGAMFYGSITTTVGQNSKDIQLLKETKADLQSLIRIKADIDIRNQMIIEQLKQVNSGQQELYKLLVEHVDKDKK